MKLRDLWDDLSPVLAWYALLGVVMLVAALAKYGVQQ